MGEKLITFFEDILFKIKSFFSNPKRLKGKCKACGECCRTIVFYVGENVVKTEEQFELLKNWDKKYNNFIPNGFAPDGAMYFKCRALKDDGKCRTYFLRSIPCRMYPKVNSFLFSRGDELKPNCGYYYENDKNFEDFLK